MFLKQKPQSGRRGQAALVFLLLLALAGIIMAWASHQVRTKGRNTHNASWLKESFDEGWKATDGWFNTLR